MNLLSRSIAGIKAGPTKGLILFLTIFILGCVISGAISVNAAIQSADTRLRGDLQTIVTIEVDMEEAERYAATTGEWPRFEYLTVAMLNEIGSLPYVRDYDYSVETNVLIESMKRYTSDEDLIDDIGLEEGWASITLKGVRSTEVFEFEADVVELVSGRMFAMRRKT